MDSRTVLLFCLAMFLAILAMAAEGRTKKVIIHVPYKVKKIKHTHTVYKTVHHHHKHHDFHNHLEHPGEEHEHFHHMHLLEEPIHGQSVPSMAIPDYLPDVPIDDAIDLSELEDLPIGPTRHMFLKRD